MSLCSECHSEARSKQNPLQTHYKDIFCLRTKWNQDASLILFISFSSVLMALTEGSLQPLLGYKPSRICWHREIPSSMSPTWAILYCSVLTSGSLDVYFWLFLQVGKLLNANLFPFICWWSITALEFMKCNYKYLLTREYITREFSMIY